MNEQQSVKNPSGVTRFLASWRRRSAADAADTAPDESDVTPPRHVSIAPKHWFKIDKALTANSAVQLFCFPYAGGSSAFYKDWQRKLGRAIEVIPVELPGRGTRLPEPPYRRLMPLIADLETAIAPLLDKPYAFFGHSMGAVIAFELTRRIFLSDRPMPSYLFISGCSAPYRRSSELVHKLPDAQLIDRLGKLNGTPPEILQNAELLSIVLPFLRADFELIETYEYRHSARPVLPVTVLGGKDDGEAKQINLLAWQERFEGAFQLHMLPGDHLFIKDNTEQIMNIITALHPFFSKNAEPNADR